jgi:hypothetical protein
MTDDYLSYLRHTEAAKDRTAAPRYQHAVGRPRRGRRTPSVAGTAASGSCASLSSKRTSACAASER